MMELRSTGAGFEVSSVAVPLSLQIAMRLSVPLPLASSAAIELRKYSVPSPASSYCSAGLVAARSVKPGLPATAPTVSNWVTFTVAVLRASANLLNAYTWAAWNPSAKNGYSLVVM